MAKLTNSLLQIEGRLGGLVFYKVRNKIIVRSVPSFNVRKFRNSPVYQRVRENTVDFATAAKANSLFRNAFRSLIGDPISDLTGRLQRKMMELIKADEQNLRGQRSVTTAGLEQLDGFNFYPGKSMLDFATMPGSIAFDSKTATAELTLPAFPPDKCIVAPERATHFVITLGVVAIDFAKEEFFAQYGQTEHLRVDQRLVPNVVLNAALPKPTRLPVFIAMGITFWKAEGTTCYALKGSKSRGLAIIDVITNQHTKHIPMALRRLPPQIATPKP